MEDFLLLGLWQYGNNPKRACSIQSLSDYDAENDASDYTSVVENHHHPQQFVPNAFFDCFGQRDFIHRNTSQTSEESNASENTNDSNDDSEYMLTSNGLNEQFHIFHLP